MNGNNNSSHVTYKTAIVYKVEHHDLWFMIHIIWNSDHHSPASLTSPLTVLDVGQPPIHQVTHTALDPWRVMLQPKSTSTEATSHKMSQVPGPWLRRNNEKWHWDTERCHIYKLSICWDNDPSKNLSSKGPPGCPNVEEAKAPTGSGRICAAVQMRNYFKRSDLLHTFLMEHSV